ncbi:MAG: protein-L-isoaspartate(D-aspartate) O-methyltransferase [Planctomycetota bacterium]|jgi:protein-L-isoaspartate(D-aspartate) O-methyltransferase
MHPCTLLVAGSSVLAVALVAADRPDPPAASERTDERARMVEQQLAHPRDSRIPVTDEKVLEAMRAAPRHVFVPQDSAHAAYLDHPLAIGHGQTISQPYIVGLMTQLLELDDDAKVLEIGTGSAYQAAVLAHLTSEVYTIEIVKPLHGRATKTLAGQGYDDVRTRRADGYFGWPEHAPFDAIIVTCAAGHLPPPLWEQLAPGGRIVIPIGGPYQTQRLVVMTKEPDGSRRSKTILAVRFVPMTGEAQR